MGLSHPYTLSVSHDGGWRNTTCLFLGIIFILLSQNIILLLQKFAAASCSEKHPFEVAKWTHVLELLFHLLKVLPSFRYQIIVRFHLPLLDHNLHENYGLVFIPSTQNSSWPITGAQYIYRMNEWMKERKRQRYRMKHYFSHLYCTLLISIQAFTRP